LLGLALPGFPADALPEADLPKTDLPAVGFAVLFATLLPRVET
jgi:hypothetical protein